MQELGNFPGVMRGTVTRVHATVAGAAWVKVPRVHGPDVELGPFESLAGIAALAGGVGVLLAPIEGRPDDLIIIGILR